MTAIASLPFKRTQSSSAAELARRQWAGNRAALQRHQAHVIEQAGDFPADVDWVFARDGSLTCLRVYGSWWAECSVPRAAAVKLLASLDPSRLVSAYLAPAFAQLLHAARHQTGAEPALIAIVPSVETLQILLAGGDFAAEIASHRLWFVAGEDWAEELRKLFRDHPGLPPAGRFIRTKLTDAAVTEPMIAAAQDVLGEVARSRNAALQRLRSIDAGPAGTCERLMIISPSKFRLWDDAAPALEEAAAEFEAVGNGRVVRFDSDDPLNGSPLALATMAADSDAVLAANVYRSDAADLVAAPKPWLTWVTREPVRPFDPAAPRDRLIVATPTLAAAATRAHWPATAVVVAGWQDRPSAVATLAPPHLAIIADLRTVAIPRPIEDLSSHRLLWEFIDGEVDTSPFVVGGDPVGYLLGKASEIGIAADELDVPAFVDGLIIRVGSGRWRVSSSPPGCRFASTAAAGRRAWCCNRLRWSTHQSTGFRTGVRRRDRARSRVAGIGRSSDRQRRNAGGSCGRVLEWVVAGAEAGACATGAGEGRPRGGDSAAARAGFVGLTRFRLAIDTRSGPITPSPINCPPDPYDDQLRIARAIRYERQGRSILRSGFAGRT